MTRNGGIVGASAAYVVGEFCAGYYLPNNALKAHKIQGNGTFDLEVKIEQPSKLVIQRSGDHLEAHRCNQ